MRFSETPVTDLDSIQPIRESGPVGSEKGTEPSFPPALDRGTVDKNGKDGKSVEGESSTPQRTAAAGLLDNIFAEFSRLRKLNRSGAWANLEEKVANAGSQLIASGMILAKDLVGLLIDIEQFRKAEGGSAEVPGDALAKWLSEGTEVEAPKRSKKAKVQ